MTIIIKCKMCGGDVIVEDEKSTVGKCRYCGSMMTLPRIESEKKARLFNRANEYRLNNDFDKAYDAYKTITEEEEQEAEAYWGMILSEYGVEYVEDPKTGKRVPTCHRTQVIGIQSSTNFKLAIKYADGERKIMYQDEADVLDKLQKRILAVSSRVEPYDVFICYKETDDFTNERTQDSVLAQSIYKELEKENIRTFFARITLESHLGENYEPYIYAALKSARVMLVITTSGEHCEAVWVKNEWSRFLHFMSEDDSKVLIPAYSEMSPYELPSEMSGFQAQNLSKIGAIQDLVHGIQKVLGTTHTESMISRNAMLDAYVAEKLEQEERKKRRRKTALLFTIKFVVPGIVILVVLGWVLGLGYTMIAEIHNYWRTKDERVLAKDEANYMRAMEYIDEGNTTEAKKILLKLGDYKDSKELVVIIEKDPDYKRALEYIENKEYDRAVELFGNLGDYKDSREYVIYLENAKSDYLNAVEYKKNGEYDKAKELFIKLGDYKDSNAMLESLLEPDYLEAQEYLTKREYSKAEELFRNLGDYKDSVTMVQETKYRMAQELMDDGDYDNAKHIYVDLDYYKDTSEKLKAIEKYEKIQKFKNLSEGTRVSFGETEGDRQIWILVYKNDSDAIFIFDNSNRVFENKPYTECDEVNAVFHYDWENSTIKQYLNDTVYSQMANDLKEMIKKDEKYDCMVRLLTEEEMEVFSNLVPKYGINIKNSWTLDDSNSDSASVGGYPRKKTWAEPYFPVVTVDLDYKPQ